MKFNFSGYVLADAKVLDSGTVLLKVRENDRYTKDDGEVVESHYDFNVWAKNGRAKYVATARKGDFVHCEGTGNEQVDMFNNTVRVQHNVNMITDFVLVRKEGVPKTDEAVMEQEVNDPVPF